MHTPHRSFTLLLIVVLLGLCTPAFARDTLVVQEQTAVYTGPGKYFRPLTDVKAGTELPVGKKIISGRRGGEFYKVLVRLSNGRRVVGYLAKTAKFTLKSNSEAVEELESFDDYQLTKQSVQVSYAHLKTGRYLASAGYLSFVGPGLYFKGWAGALKTKAGFNPVTGVEFGSDALIAGRWSGYVAATIGVFVNPKLNSLFIGSKNDFSNFLAQGAVGVRFTTKRLSSFSIGATQASLFNANNSSVTAGAIITAEFPL